MSQEQLQVNFRMPSELKSRLEQAAQVAGRTLTAEIVVRLQASFEPTAEAKATPELMQLFLGSMLSNFGRALIHATRPGEYSAADPHAIALSVRMALALENLDREEALATMREMLGPPTLRDAPADANERVVTVLMDAATAIKLNERLVPSPASSNAATAAREQPKARRKR